MITYWQQEEGKLVHLGQDELNPAKNTWIDARSVTREDIRTLEEEFHIDQEAILDFLDQDELSRIEKDDDYTLLIIRLPVFMPASDVSYFTIPLGIVLLENKIVTICWTDCEVLRDIAGNRVKDINLKDIPAFITRILSRADSTFLRYLKEINRRSTTIQNELELAVNNDDLIQLMNLEKSLVFFTTSLRSNQLLLEKLRKTKLLRFDEEDQDWLEDVEIDNRQAMEMADNYTNIMSGATDAFSSIISNNMNEIMKKLAVINLVMMAPTFITSFFGMNYKLPFDNLPGYIPVTIAAVLCLVSIFVCQWALNFDTKRRINREKARAQKKMDKKRAKQRKRGKKTPDPFKQSILIGD